MGKIFYRHNGGAHEFYLEDLGQAPPDGAIECPRERYDELFAADPVLHRFAGPAADGLPFLEATGVVHPTPAQLEAAFERGWRDGQLQRATGIRDRHRDQLELGVDTSLTGAQFMGLLAYIQKLRDWPQSALFPAVASRPVPPAWLSAAE